jgi:hypothetical protein
MPELTNDPAAVQAVIDELGRRPLAVPDSLEQAPCQGQGCRVSNTGDLSTRFERAPEVDCPPG